MRRNRCLRKTVSGIMVLAFGFLSVFVAPLQAAMVQTADVLSERQAQSERQKVADFMERQDVARQLEAWGVDAEEARARVAAMTDEEIHLLSQKIDQMPAGGDAVGFLLAVAVLAFVTLIITDIIGVTDVFTFIKKR